MGRGESVEVGDTLPRRAEFDAACTVTPGGSGNPGNCLPRLQTLYYLHEGRLPLPQHHGVHGAKVIQGLNRGGVGVRAADDDMGVCMLCTD